MNETSEPPLFDAQSAISARDVLARALARAALAAGPAVMEEYARGAEARAKADGSPVTVADERAEAIIRERLEKLAPLIPIIAEEAVAAGAPLTVADQFFLVDPLDGPANLSPATEIHYHIALVSLGAPVAGRLRARIGPALSPENRSFVCNVAIGANLPASSHWRRLRTREAPKSLEALASRSHADPETEAFLSRLPIGARKSAGSSLKFCVIAEGEADDYPRFAPTMEWIRRPATRFYAPQAAAYWL